MEIVTWVLRGSLVHQDSDGHSGVIYPGLAQRMSAGHGHPALGEERLVAAAGAAEHNEPVHFVQMWVVPDEAGITPGYEQLEIDDELLRGGLVPGRVGHGPARRRGGHPDQEQVRRPARGAAASRARRSNCPGAPFVHLFVARGTVTLEGAGPLDEGDAVRFTGTGGQQVTAIEPAEILVWEMHATIAGW